MDEVIHAVVIEDMKVVVSAVMATVMAVANDADTVTKARCILMRGCQTRP
jgi:hypothetical protein